jgi:hypothetical protein
MEKEALLVDSRDPLETGFQPDIGHAERPALRANQARHPLAEPEPDPAHTFLRQPVGRGQHQLAGVRVPEVERADGRARRLPRLVDDRPQNLLVVAGGRGAGEQAA